MVTHELASAFAIADRIALVNAGKILITGTPDEVRACDNPIVTRFIHRQPAEGVEHDDQFRRLMLGLETPAV